MLPLLVLLGLICTGYYITRSEIAEPFSETDVPDKIVPKSNHIPKKMPSHGNMTAHYTNSQVGDVRQPPGLLERTAGAPGMGMARKTEISNTSVLSKNTPMPDVDRSRFHVSSAMDGIKPFEPSREAPDDPRNVITPKTVDELRSPSNPRVVNPGLIIPGSGGTQFRGSVGCVTSEREICPQEHIPTARASVSRGFNQGEILAPSTSRSGYTLPLPHANSNTGSRYVDSQFMRKSNSELPAVSGGPSGNKHRSSRSDMNMYSTSLCPTERVGVSEPRLGLASGMEPHGYEDFASGESTSDRMNRRALTTPNPRVYGSVQQVNPPRLTTFDPADTTRTTMKETFIHDSVEGNLGCAPSGPMYSPSADARQTVRETLPSVQGSRGDGRLDTGATTSSKPPVYDPFDIPVTTGRETLTHCTQSGNIGGIKKPSAQKHSIDTTQRSMFHTNYIGSPSVGRSDGYLVSDINVPKTMRQTTTDNEYSGGAGPTSNPAGMTYSEIYTKVMGDIKETVLKNRQPKGRKEIVASGKDRIGSARQRRDDCVDNRVDRKHYQHQGRVQSHIKPSCSSDTRGGRQSMDGTPDVSVLNQLRSNPYSLHTGSMLGDHQKNC